MMTTRRHFCADFSHREPSEVMGKNLLIDESQELGSDEENVSMDDASQLKHFAESFYGLSGTQGAKTKKDEKR